MRPYPAKFDGLNNWCIAVLRVGWFRCKIGGVNDLFLLPLRGRGCLKISTRTKRGNVSCEGQRMRIGCVIGSNKMADGAVWAISEDISEVCIADPL